MTPRIPYRGMRPVNRSRGARVSFRYETGEIPQRHPTIEMNRRQQTRQHVPTTRYQGGTVTESWETTG